MSDQSAKSVKPARISFYGNFGAGNLGNECTLQAIIEQIEPKRALFDKSWQAPDIEKMASA